MTKLLEAFLSDCSFFFNATATTEIYTLSLHDALPIWLSLAVARNGPPQLPPAGSGATRSEEHTSELQSRGHLVCRLLLEQKKKKPISIFLLKKKKIKKLHKTQKKQK